MLYRKIIAVCSQIHTKHINTLCGQNVEFMSVKPHDTHSNQRALETRTLTTLAAHSHSLYNRSVCNTLDHSAASCRDQII
jgi:hypothetical protein